MVMEGNQPVAYNWYQKLGELMNRTTLAPDVYGKNPMDAWAILIGLKQSKVTQNINERGEAARRAAQATEEKLQQTLPYK